VKLKGDYEGGGERVELEIPNVSWPSGSEGKPLAVVPMP